MKPFFFLPFLCVGLVGCNASSAQNGGTTPAAAPVAVAPDKPTAPAADAPATPAAKTYRVVSAEAQPPGSDKYRFAPPPLSTKIPDHPRVVMLTSRGPITLELDAKAAPLHVRSMLYLASKGFYNGIKFHRYADLLGNGQGFIIQGGDPLTKTAETAQYAGNGGPGYEIPREYNSLKHVKLVIAAARSKDPDSAGSQFYITQNAVPFLDEGDGYTVFGKVVGGEKAALALRQDDVIKKRSASKVTEISMPDSSLFEPGQPLHVRLYGRPDCKLCNEAAQALNQLHSTYDFWVEKINIDDDPAIKEKLHELIPVVTFNGGNRVVVPVTDEKLRRAFKKALRLEDSAQNGAGLDDDGWTDAMGTLQPERRASTQVRQPERRTGQSS